jgi:hypothetical protein
MEIKKKATILETKRQIKITSGPAIEKVGDLASILTNLAPGDIVFIDECSTIDNRTMELLLGKISNDALIVMSGDVYQIESIDFGNWFFYAKDIVKAKENDEILEGVEHDVNKFEYESRKVYYSKGMFSNFINKNDGLILQVPVPPSLGIPNNFINKNIGSMENKGFEFSLGADLVKNENFTWNVNGNLTLMDNKVLSLVDGSDIIGSQNGQTAYLIRVGESVRSLYGFKYWGVNMANGNPVYYKANGTLVQGNLSDGSYYVFDPSNPSVFGAKSSLGSSPGNDDRH